MKNFLSVLLLICTLSSFAQPTNLATAETSAKKEGKLILIEFSGSDWCIPCIRLEKEVFSKDTFAIYAASHLVLLQADFPRIKKHQLPKTQKAANEALAALYNKEGSFPYTVLLDADGIVLRSWEGNSVGTAEAFVAQLQSLSHDK